MDQKVSQQARLQPGLRPEMTGSRPNDGARRRGFFRVSLLWGALTRINVPVIGFMAAGILTLGCGDDGHPWRFGTGTGRLELSWSIDSVQTSAACESLGAARFYAAIYRRGWLVTELSRDCRELNASLDLYAGDYAARMTLFDARGKPVTRRIVLDPIRIARGEVTSINVDFPGAVPSDAGTAVDGGISLPDAGAPADGGLALDAGALPDAALEADAGTAADAGMP